MTANEIRELQRDLESGRPVSPERVLRAVQFAADVAKEASGTEWATTDVSSSKAAYLGDVVADLAFVMHKEMVP